MCINLIVMRRVIEFKQLILVGKSKGHTPFLARAIRHFFLFQTDDIEIRYDCGERFHVLLKKNSKGILFGL